MTDHLKTTDALKNHWIYRHMPDAAVPYLQLIRADRPIGTWLLYWPCAWSILMAGYAGGDVIGQWRWIILFFIGAYVMRGAGCVVNDLADKDFDAAVERTRNRPIPSGRVSPKQALIFLGGVALVGLLILLQLNLFAIILGASSLLLVVIYPFMKRITYWPQLVLGLTFNWGALLGWAAVQGELALPAILLYAGGLFWTLGYDTIYAHQDKEDDIQIGVKSTALKLGEQTLPWLIGFYAMAWLLFMMAGKMIGLGLLYYVGGLFMLGQLIWQITGLNINDPDTCLKLFKSNHHFGAIFAASILLGSL